jgi:hypothetical protein
VAATPAAAAGGRFAILEALEIGEDIRRMVIEGLCVGDEDQATAGAC